LSACPSDKGFLQKLARGLEGIEWARARCAVAVSGGADSVALAVATAELARMRTPTPQLVILHVNHGLRGRASGADQRHVRSLARKLKLPFRVEKITLPDKDSSSEQVLREARYAALIRMAHEARLRFIFTAHTADDQAETVLLNIARGAGLPGLAGIPRRRVLTARPRIEVVRPALELTHREMCEFLRSRSIAWREDASNVSSRYVRNRVRRRALPALVRDVNPKAAQHLARLAALAADAQNVIAAEARKLLPKKLSPPIALDAAALRCAPKAVAREAVRRAARAAAPGAAVTAERVDAVLALLERRGSAKRIELGSGASAAREFERLVFSGPERRRKSAAERAARLLPDRPRKFGRWTIILKKRPAKNFKLRSFLRGKGEFEEVFDAAALQEPIRVRRRSDGDRLLLAGGKSKKLKAVLAEGRVPARCRDRVPVVTDSSGRVLWVVGVRRSHAALVGPKTDELILITAKAVRSNNE